MAGSPDIDCVICGACITDILVRPAPLAVPGGRPEVHIDPIEVVTGGIVSNTGIAMRWLGMRVAAVIVQGGQRHFFRPASCVRGLAGALLVPAGAFFASSVESVCECGLR